MILGLQARRKMDMILPRMMMIDDAVHSSFSKMHIKNAATQDCGLNPHKTPSVFIFIHCPLMLGLNVYVYSM